MIETNPNVILTITAYGRYQFTPAEGYALWRDNEEANLDENGNPLCYWMSYTVPTEARAIAQAPHIHAKLIEPGMEVFGTTVPTNPPVTE